MHLKICKLTQAYKKLSAGLKQNSMFCSHPSMDKIENSVVKDINT